MRILSPTPHAFVDPTTGGPAFGSYRGPLPRIDLGPQLLDRALRRKKWFYVGIASDRVWISMAIVRMGYATSCFAFVHDLASKKMLADETIVGPPRVADIADDIHADGIVARFGFGKTNITIERQSHDLVEIRARFGGSLQINASLDESNAPPPIAAIAQLGQSRGQHSLPSATEKRVLANVRGSVSVAGNASIDLESAFGAYDYTHGLMPRHTRWRWALGMGHATDGEPIGFNVTSGFVGEAECAAFRRSSSTASTATIHPIHEPYFDFDVDHPERAWHLKGEGIDLVFDVGAVHAQRTNLLLVRSRFLQPAGTFRGTLRIGDRDVELAGVPGVVEDQDVLW